MKVIVIDYKTGNVGSILNMLKKLSIPAELTNNLDKIACADKLILPGVGHFDYGMRELNSAGITEVLNETVIKNKVPILGICLGVQLFTEYSDEGKEKGLGWFKGCTKKFSFTDSDSRKLPHMGWTDVIVKNESKLFKDFNEVPRFYFVHSYHLNANDTNEIMATASYGYEFAAGLERENIVGVQFHPEKSHKFGMKILKNFVLQY